MSDRLDKLKAMHEQEPEDTFCTYGIAMEYLKEENWDEALAWLNRTLGIDPDYAYAWYQKGRLLSRIGRAEDAHEALKLGLAAARKQNDAKALSELESLLTSLGH